MKNFLLSLCVFFGLLTSGFASAGENIHVLILLMYYSNTSPGSISTSSAQSSFTANTDAYYQNASYNQAVITEEAHGWYRLPCTRDTCTWGQIDDAATAAAQAQGVNTSAFEHRLYMIAGGVPTSICGGAVSCGTGSLTQGWAWTGVSNDPPTQIHEFGHSLGFNHADIGLIGGAGVYGGDGGVLPGAYRRQANWIDAVPILTSGTFSLSDIGQGGSVYTINNADGTTYTLDYRQSYYGSPTLFVEFDSGFFTYVYVRNDSCGAQGLTAGKSYYDPDRRILFTMNSGTVSVTLDSNPVICPPTPTPTATPIRTPTPTATPKGHGHGH